MTTFVDMFAGIGGFRLAFERLGWKSVGYIENDKKSLQSYRANFDISQEYFWDDATTLDPNSLPDFDILAAGFPCQPWSAAGKRGGFEDARGTLFFDIARVLRAKNPRAFLLENVKGLLFEENKPSFNRMLSILRSLGYAISVKVLNSRDFGVPQNRERVFFAGFKANGFQESEFIWPKPLPRSSKLSDRKRGLSACHQGNRESDTGMSRRLRSDYRALLQILFTCIFVGIIFVSLQEVDRMFLLLGGVTLGLGFGIGIGFGLRGKRKQMENPNPECQSQGVKHLHQGMA